MRLNAQSKNSAAPETGAGAKLLGALRPCGIRNRIQLAVLLLTLLTGLQFLVYVHQAAGTGAISVSRPAGVDGFLPIGGLLGWKLFVSTGMWDPAHPAAMVIFGFALVLSFAFRKVFCGWFCPVGTLSEILWKLGKKITGKNYTLPLWLDYPLGGLKYVPLGFFLWAVFSMDTQMTAGFISADFYKLSDVKMLHFFTRMSITAGGIIFLISVISLFVRNFWCRYLCPYGILTGLLAMVGPTAIHRNEATCIGCGQCEKACPSNLPVHRKRRIISPECNGCMTCTQACPVPDTLVMKTAGCKTPWTTLSLGLVVIGLFWGIIYTAKISNHWQSHITDSEFRMLLKKNDAPRFSSCPRSRE